MCDICKVYKGYKANKLCKIIKNIKFNRSVTFNEKEKKNHWNFIFKFSKGNVLSMDYSDIISSTFYYLFIIVKNAPKEPFLQMKHDLLNVEPSYGKNE